VSTEQERAVVHLAELARLAAHQPLDTEADRIESARLVARLRREARPSSTSWAPRLALAAALVIGVGVLGFRLWPRPLDYQVRGVQSSGPYVSASEARPALVEFSDGSRVEAEPGARFRVEERKSNGARVLLERGRAHVSIVHRDGADWSFAAGPFDVKVTGTRFELAWDPARESIDLTLREGSVEVRGPLADAPIAVRAGQKFHADMASRSMTVVDGDAKSAAPAPPPSAPAPATADLAPAEPTVTEKPPSQGTAPAPATAAARESWTKLVAGGEFETVIRLATDRGTSSCVRTCGASDLRALADAARYSGRTDLALEALLGLRDRFRGSGEERSASFLLGRVEESRGAMARAQTWYDTYLRERPGGELAAEALAGRMRSVSATSGRKAASPLARDYLSRYPNGVHAEAARAMLDAP
jgi:hypothetical protein